MTVHFKLWHWNDQLQFRSNISPGFGCFQIARVHFSDRKNYQILNQGCQEVNRGFRRRSSQRILRQSSGRDHRPETNSEFHFSPCERSEVKNQAQKNFVHPYTEYPWVSVTL